MGVPIPAPLSKSDLTQELSSSLQPTTGVRLLDIILESTRQTLGAGAGSVQTQTKKVEQTEQAGQRLADWLRAELSQGKPGLKERLTRVLSQTLGFLDDLLSRQTNAVLHHPRFQQFEASWRGLFYLVDQLPDEENIKIRVLNVSWTELVRDQESALEFDQSQLFRKVYSEEFGTPGGEPFGVLLGDYQIHPHPSQAHPTDDLEALKSIAGVAAASFAPFLTAAHPSLLALDNFIELEKPINLSAPFEQVDFLKWRALREEEDSRFVGLLMPRVLLRLPYTPEQSFGFCFREDVSKPDRSEYLWGNPIYAYGAVLMRAYSTTGWLSNIRGGRVGTEEGGIVTDLPSHSFSTDQYGLIPKSSTEVVITDPLDKELGDLGFLPLCWSPSTERSVFYGTQSIQKPKNYDEQSATVNARLSAMLQSMFCTSRIAHYVKILTREQIGSFFGPSDCEELLRRWLAKYTNAAENPSPELKSRYPLREFKVQIREIPGKPGQYRCILHLRPQFQLDQLAGSVRLVTTLSGGQPR